MFILVTVRKLGVFRRWILCQVLSWFCLYQVQTLPGIIKGQHLKDLHGFVSFSDFMTEDPQLSPGFFINIETCARNFKVDIMLIQVPSEYMNACANPAEKVNESYAGILLHHNFASCKEFRRITSGPPPQKEGNSWVHISFSVCN